ncbi:MAG: L-2-hydroxyglutarate oxidase [Micromonosporaceae bacterium]|nr:L-2-hydroxyglutarate oxidase [Micromonosporaceae bacterium]
MRHVVVGGGIVGLAVARRIQLDRPGDSVTVVEKETRWGVHQTGHNSGVLHAGVYYRPGSLKARLCRAGRASMVDFCRRHGIPVEICGKLIVAVEPDELPRLRDLHDRALVNGLAARLLEPAEAAEHEPHAACVAALHVPETGVTDFAAVCRALAGLLAQRGADLRTGARVTGIRATGVRGGREIVVETSAGEIVADVLVNCAGLHSDRIARLAGLRPPVAIVPFRGEYFQLRPERRSLVRGLIYPAPDPSLPFLGVHLTRGVDGSVHAGPNAVLALAREGYRWSRIRPGELAGTLAYPGFWRLARRHGRHGVAELRRSLSRRRFAERLARLVPSLTAADLQVAEAGVRAQAVTRDGALVDDFLIVSAPGQVHVLNAPSPAATSALEIAKEVVRRMPA